MLTVAWVVIPVGALVSGGVCAAVLALHSRSSGKGEPEVPAYREAVVLHGGWGPVPAASYGLRWDPVRGGCCPSWWV